MHDQHKYLGKANSNVYKDENDEVLQEFSDCPDTQDPIEFENSSIETTSLENECKIEDSNEENIKSSVNQSDNTSDSENEYTSETENDMDLDYDIAEAKTEAVSKRTETI